MKKRPGMAHLKKITDVFRCRIYRLLIHFYHIMGTSFKFCQNIRHRRTFCGWIRNQDIMMLKSTKLITWDTKEMNKWISPKVKQVLNIAMIMMHNFLVVFHKNNSLPIGPINLHLILLKSSMSETIIWYHLVYSMQVHSFHFKHSILLRMTLWFAWQGIINLLTFKSQLRFQWSTSSLLPKRTVKCKQIVNI